MESNFLISEKASNALTKMREKECTLEELELTKQEIDDLISATGNIKYNNSKKTYYITKFNENNFEIISFVSKEQITEKWVELTDIYFGSQFLDEKTLKFVMDTVKVNRINNIHISGDLCAGHPSFKNQHMYLTEKSSKDQAERAIKFFSNYPEFKYYCINGERDLSFEKNGEINPIVLVQQGLSEKNIEFHHINETVADLVIRGIVKRLQHAIGKVAYTKSYKIEKEMWELFENSLDNVIIKGRGYKIGFVQFGHHHVTSYQVIGRTIVTSSSGMIFDDKEILKENTSYPSAKICEATIKNGKIIRYVTENIIKPEGIV